MNAPRTMNPVNVIEPCQRDRDARAVQAVSGHGRARRGRLRRAPRQGQYADRRERRGQVHADETARGRGNRDVRRNLDRRADRAYHGCAQRGAARHRHHLSGTESLSRHDGCGKHLRGQRDHACGRDPLEGWRTIRRKCCWTGCISRSIRARDSAIFTWASSN